MLKKIYSFCQPSSKKKNIWIYACSILCITLVSRNRKSVIVSPFKQNRSEALPRSTAVGIDGQRQSAGIPRQTAQRNAVDGILFMLAYEKKTPSLVWKICSEHAL